MLTHLRLRFITLIIREQFDYTKWQENLYNDIPLKELCEKADDFWHTTHCGNPNADTLEAMEDARLNRNLYGPFSSGEEAVKFMLED